MDFTCANCKSRWTWDCEDYHHGYFGTEKCKEFILDFDTLSDSDKDFITNLAKSILEYKK